MIRTSLLNIFLRTITLASKFILMMFMAKYLMPEDIGIYGLMTVTLGLTIYILGMDFYVFNTREILKGNEEDKGIFIRDQLIFHGILYVIILPLISTVFFIGILPWRYIGWFYVLLICEHLAQEAYRLLTTLSRPVLANLILFLRSGIWIYGFVGFAFFFENARNIKYIWLGWSLGAILSIIITVLVLKRNVIWNKPSRVPINWLWIKKGVITSLPFFGGTLAFKLMEYADRYFIKFYHGEEMVGIYTFYFSFANVVQVFIFSGVIMILYPKIVYAYQQGDLVEYKMLMSKMSKNSIIVGIVLSIFAGIFILPLLMIIKKSIYLEYVSTYWVLLLAIFANILSQIPHYALFVRNKDKAILVSAVLALIVSISVNYKLVPLYGVLGASISNFVSMTSILIIKVLFLISISRKRIC